VWEGFASREGGKNPFRARGPDEARKRARRREIRSEQTKAGYGFIAGKEGKGSRGEGKESLFSREERNELEAPLAFAFLGFPEVVGRSGDGGAVSKEE